MSYGVVSEYYLERFVLGELPPEDAGEVARAAAVDPRVRAALDAIDSSNRAILARYPAEDFKSGLLSRLETAEGGAPGLGRRRFFPERIAFPWKRSLAFASAAAALLIAAVLIVPGIKGPSHALPPGSGLDDAVVKGEAGIDLRTTQLLVYRKDGELAETMKDGNVAEPGDLLQLAYVAASEHYGVILSIDGRGGVTRHFPAEEGGSTLLALNKRSLLPNAIELDDAPGYERFFLVTSKTPIDIAAVVAKAGDLAADPGQARSSDMDLPAGLKQRSVLILKGEGSR
jgi:hypothetical protein